MKMFLIPLFLSIFSSIIFDLVAVRQAITTAEKKETSNFEKRRELIERNLASSRPTPFICARLTSEHSPASFCSGIVTYSFYLPLKSTIEQLEASVRGEADKFSTLFLNGECLTALKKDICARTYLPCSPPDQSNVSISENKTELPYLRPCRSLCTSIHLACDASLLTSANASTPCAASDSYYPAIPQYTSKFCNRLSESPPSSLVSTSPEPYIGEICKGIIHDIYIPRASTVNTSFAPWQPPYFLQRYIESTITSVESSIPRYFPTKCLLARRELVCSKHFLKPFQTSLNNHTIYLPSFPDRRICQNYVKQCSSSLISLLPSYNITCDERKDKNNDNNVYIYPEGSQIVSVINLFSETSFILVPSNNLTDKNYSQVLSSSITTECPYGTYPSAYSSRRSTEIPFTACSLQCPFPYFTPSEADWMFSQISTSLYIVLFITLLQTVNLFILKRIKKKQNLFIISLIVITCFYHLIQFIQIIFIRNNKHHQDSLCVDEIIPYSLHLYTKINNNSNSFHVSACLLQPLSYLYCYFLYCWICFSVSCEIWCMIYWEMKNISSSLRYRYIIGSGLLLLSNTLFVQLYDSLEIETSEGVFCSWSSENPQNSLLLRLPSIIIFILSLMMMFHSLYICFKTSYSIESELLDFHTLPRDSKNEKQYYKDYYYQWMKSIWNSYSMLILFLMLEIIYFSINIVYYQFYYFDNSENNLNKWLQGASEWIHCLFQKFITSSNTDYLEICGTIPSLRPSPNKWMIPYLINMYGNSLLLYFMTFNKEVKHYYRVFFLSFFEIIGIKRLLLFLASLSLISYYFPHFTDEKIHSFFLINKESRRRSLSKELNHSSPNNSLLIRRSITFPHSAQFNPYYSSDAVPKRSLTMMSSSKSSPRSLRSILPSFFTVSSRSTTSMRISTKRFDNKVGVLHHEDIKIQSSYPSIDDKPSDTVLKEKNDRISEKEMTIIIEEGREYEECSQITSIQGNTSDSINNDDEENNLHESSVRSVVMLLLNHLGVAALSPRFSLTGQGVVRSPKIVPCNTIDEEDRQYPIESNEGERATSTKLSLLIQPIEGYEGEKIIHLSEDSPSNNSIQINSKLSTLSSD